MQRGGRLKTGQRIAGRVAHIDLDQRPAVRKADIRLHLPMAGVLRARSGDLAREGEAGLIGVLGFEAAEGRYGGADHDAVDDRDDGKERDHADQDHATGDRPA